MKQTIYLSEIDFLTPKNCVWICGCVDFAGINQEIQVFQSNKLDRLHLHNVSQKQILES